MSVTSKPGQDLQKREDLITLTIDDVEVSVPKGTLVIRAAELIGVEIPRFCDHPLLDPVGACRQCMVEVSDAGNGRPMPKPQASCTLEVAPGMVVKTQVTSPVADKAQHGQMEFLLVNHPLDCPICDKGGECPLQNQSMSNGYAESRFHDTKRTYPKPVHLSANVLLDRERCILCARCTRFAAEIAGDPSLVLIERSALQQVATYDPEPFQSYFSGNTIQICPVGALTSAAYRFRSRPFDLVSVPSIAEHDACGSAIRVDYRRGLVMRRLAGDDPEVNEEWITDKDRYAFAYGRGPDRLTRPLVRHTDADGDTVMRPASWPEAIDVAVRGLQAALRPPATAAGDEAADAIAAASPGSRVGVLTGGRLTQEDAYGYAKFARAVLGTNNIDFRSRPNSREEAEFLAHAVAGTGRGVTYADLEQARRVLLVAFEPEEEAGAIFLRLRKAVRKKGLRVATVAPYLSNGNHKLDATLVATAPGAEARVLADLPVDLVPDADTIILVGERAALASGTLSAVLDLAEHTGARLAWVPRRAGDRGAIEAGCLPDLLPGGRPVGDPAARVDVAATWGSASLPTEAGRDIDEMLFGAGDAELGGLIVAGVDPGDLLDPTAALEGLEKVGFVVSIETRASAVTERADVVLPVSLIEERPGTFVTWEGRERHFETVFVKPSSMSDLRVLAALADGLGRPLGLRTAAQARAELVELGWWSGVRAAAPRIGAGTGVEPGPDRVLLATWRMQLDDSSAMSGEPYLRDTAQPPVAVLHPDTAAAAGVADRVRVSNDNGSITLPVRLAPEMVPGVVWLPTRPPGYDLASNLAAAAGDPVRIEPATESLPGGHVRSEHDGGAVR